MVACVMRAPAETRQISKESVPRAYALNPCRSSRKVASVLSVSTELKFNLPTPQMGKVSVEVYPPTLAGPSLLSCERRERYGFIPTLRRAVKGHGSSRNLQDQEGGPHVPSRPSFTHRGQMGGARC